jgi:cytochrome c oxidase assembly protein subunit 15
MYAKAEQRFLKVNLISIISLFLLILAGGIVRSSGSGMGCPDWPKCFDQYIPPTNVSQLPQDYKEKYVAGRLKKNERFAKLLDKSGYSNLAIKVRHDESIKIPEEFNPFKTYIEYINRLIGAITGIFLLLNFVFALKLFNNRSRIFWWSALNLVLVIIQAWLGSIVVSTNLLAWLITVHMLLAILILAITIYTYYDVKSYKNEISISKSIIWVKIVAVIAIITSVIQITIGTEVRETIDFVSFQYPELKRGEWLNEVGKIFIDHREFALIIVTVNLGLFFIIRKRLIEVSILNSSASYLLIILGAQIITGIALSHFGLAPWAQATHVLFATMLFGCQFYLSLIIWKIKFLAIR